MLVTSQRCQTLQARRLGCVVVFSDLRLCFATWSRLLIFLVAQTYWIKDVLDVFLGRALDTARCDMVSGPPLCGSGPGPCHMVCLTWTPRRGPTFALLTGNWKWFLGSRSKPFLCPTRPAGLVQIFPEECGGQILHVPTSLWALQKFQLLEGVNKAQ